MLFGREVWNKVQYGAPTEFLETELRTGRSHDDKSTIHVI
jgi:hypothetical protein